MAEQASSARYASVTPEGTPPSSPREAHAEQDPKTHRDEQIDAARRNEIAILSNLRHENIIGYTKELDGSLKLEQLDTSLDVRLREPQQLTLFQKLVVMRHVAQALTYLHNLARPVLHLNVQPSSIQLGSKAGIFAKLGQFGVSGWADELSAKHETESQLCPTTLRPQNDSSSQNQTSSPASPGYESSSVSSPQSHTTSSESSTSLPSTPTDPTTPTPAQNNSAKPLPMGFGAIPTRKPSVTLNSTTPSQSTSNNGTSAPTQSQPAAGSANSSNSQNPSPPTSAPRPSAPSPAVLAQMRGAPIYNPPEAFRGDPYTTAADVYSFGLTMSELMMGSSPFAAVRSLAGLVAAMHAAPVLPDDLPLPIAKLLAQCRSVEPGQRPTFTEILETINGLFVPIFVHENISWARAFWRESFADSISVRWSDFAAAVIRTLHLPTSPNEITFRGVQSSKDDESGFATRRLHVLKQLFFPGLADDTDFMRTINLWVDIDKYGHLMGTFSDENTCMDNFLQNLASLVETGWFHGDATGSSGPHRLGPDTFLIRLSAPAQNSLKPPNCWYTFSLKTSAGNFVRETRIQRVPGKAECLLANASKEVFPSLHALVEAKGKPYGPAPCASFLFSTLHPVAAEYNETDGSED